MSGQKVTVVTYSTFLRWIRETEEAQTKVRRPLVKKQGRPRIDESLTEAIIRIRTDTGWGYAKIVQALRRLGHKVSRQTVKNVINQAGLGPTPFDAPDTWTDFIERHAATMWQCDFASKKKWTMKGLVDVYFLVFIHIQSRRIWISPCSMNPSQCWTAQQARNFDMHLQETGLQCQVLQRDHDFKYGKHFDRVFTSGGCRVKITPVKSPNLQAHVERVIQTLKHEVLNAFCIVSEAHLNYILRVSQDWYNRRRGHSARDNLPPVMDDPPMTIDLSQHKLVRLEELGGHLKSYHAAA